jgi:hypothetical protein
VELKDEFKLIDIEHQRVQKMVAEIKVLRTLLKIERKKFVPIQDIYEANKIFERYPDFLDMYGGCRR